MPKTKLLAAVLAISLAVNLVLAVSLAVRAQRVSAALERVQLRQIEAMLESLSAEARARVEPAIADDLEAIAEASQAVQAWRMRLRDLLVSGDAPEEEMEKAVKQLLAHSAILQERTLRTTLVFMQHMHVEERRRMLERHSLPRKRNAS